MDQIRQMQVFIQVMESGNFTRAAEALNVPRSTVSTLIQALEDRLGVQLLRRTTRRMIPTVEGLEFLKTAREIVEAIEASEQMFRSVSPRLKGRLRIDMPSRIGRRIIIPALSSLIEMHPDLELEVSMTDRMVDMISEGIDCVIRVGDLSSSDLICRKLGEVDIITCASPDYLACRGTPESPDDLSGHLLVNYAPRFQTGPAAWTYIAHGKLNVVNMKSMISVNNVEGYLAAARAGMGLIQIPAFDVQDLIERDALVEVLSGFRAASMPLSFLYARRRNVPVRIQVFQNWVSDLLRREGVFGPVL
ncbi:LysR family transcriptional regulator [Advenella kashmirensis W13003]|uniref:LysR family transcriptional regulator n=1 Tax=Advenella kashmirensis W13003 TaxID=1424334 RepID=V8QPB3_9BURK|nr:LysR family transcriptional regulator [Advenella kashmirensis]ETF01168.1 LysR family transcriptional regulator [Advenella kashmirensis W13003]